jgi:hypothetical protein
LREQTDVDQGVFSPSAASWADLSGNLDLCRCDFTVQLMLVASAQADTRIALVIGNSAYKNVAQLPNPVHDAQDTAAALQRMGFTVTETEDVDFIGFRNRRSQW